MFNVNELIKVKQPKIEQFWVQLLPILTIKTFYFF